MNALHKLELLQALHFKIMRDAQFISLKSGYRLKERATSLPLEPSGRTPWILRGKPHQPVPKRILVDVIAVTECKCRKKLRNDSGISESPTRW
jgi:hypothetical protein